MAHMRTHLAFSTVIFLAQLVSVASGQTSSFEEWKHNSVAAAAASKQGHFSEAERLLLTNEKLAEKFPPKDARLPQTFFDLAQVYRAEGKYSQALALYEHDRQIYVQSFGVESTELADTLNGEGELYKALGDYAHAEPLLAQSLHLRQKLLKPDDQDIAESENDLGELYILTGAYDQAEPLLLSALDLRKKHAEQSVETAQTVEALGDLYKNTNRAQQAEQSYREAVSIFGKTTGGDHPDYANALENLALICEARRDFSTAEALLSRVLEMRKDVYGPEHRDVATSLEDLAVLKRDENKPAEAIPYGEQALAIFEKILGPDSPELAPALCNLGAFYEVTSEKGKAEPLFLRALALDEKSAGVESAEVGTDLNNLGTLYLVMKRYDDAAKSYERAMGIRIKLYGESDPLVVGTMTAYASALLALNRTTEYKQVRARIQAAVAKHTVTLSK